MAHRRRSRTKTRMPWSRRFSAHKTICSIGQIRLVVASSILMSVTVRRAEVLAPLPQLLSDWTSDATMRGGCSPGLYIIAAQLDLQGSHQCASVQRWFCCSTASRREAAQTRSRSPQQ